MYLPATLQFCHLIKCLDLEIDTDCRQKALFEDVVREKLQHC